MKEKFLLAIIITLALSWIHGLSATTANRSGGSEPVEDFHPKPVAHWVQDY